MENEAVLGSNDALPEMPGHALRGTPESIPVRLIDEQPLFAIRASNNEDAIEDYAEAMRRGDELSACHAHSRGRAFQDRERAPPG